MTKDEPRQLLYKPKANKTTKPELKLDEAEPKTETGTTNKTLLQLGTTEGTGVRYRGYHSPPQSSQSPCHRREIKVEQPWPDGDTKKKATAWSNSSFPKKHARQPTTLTADNQTMPRDTAEDINAPCLTTRKVIATTSSIK